MMKIQNGMRQEIVRNGRKMGTCDNRRCCIGAYYCYNTVINHQTRMWHKHYIEIILPLISSYSYYSHKKRGNEEKGDLYRRIFASFHSFIHYFTESICFAFSPWFISSFPFSIRLQVFDSANSWGQNHFLYLIWFNMSLLLSFNGLSLLLLKQSFEIRYDEISHTITPVTHKTISMDYIRNRK